MQRTFFDHIFVYLLQVARGSGELELTYSLLFISSGLFIACGAVGQHIVYSIDIVGLEKVKIACSAG